MAMVSLPFFTLAQGSAHLRDIAWQPNTISTNYWLQVAADSNFFYMVNEFHTSETVATLELPAGVYFVRVCGTNDDTSGEWSSTRRLVVGNAAVSWARGSWLVGAGGSDAEIATTELDLSVWLNHRYYLGICHHLRGNDKKAAQIMGAVLEQDPSYADRTLPKRHLKRIRIENRVFSVTDRMHYPIDLTIRHIITQHIRSYSRYSRMRAWEKSSQSLKRLNEMDPCHPAVLLRKDSRGKLRDRD